MRLVYERNILDLGKAVKVSVAQSSWNTEIFVVSENRVVILAINANSEEHTDEQRVALAHQIATLMDDSGAYEVTADLRLQKLDCK